MVEACIGERVSLRGDTFVILGIAPASVVPRVVLLEDPETGHRVEAEMDEITPDGEGGVAGGRMVPQAGR